ncbi:MAG: IS1380 family transposase [Lachnospiraceae bacterium]|nr:IS1380 family transposase [Lachnospiraceae bacterium]
MKPTHFQIEFTKERIIPSGGLTLVGHILENSGLIDRLNKQDVTGRRSGHQIKNGDILGSYIGCLCMGKPDFEAIRETDDDPEFFCQAMGIERIPSAESLRQRMDEIGSSMRSSLLWENTQLLVKNHASPSRLPCGFVPVDIDVTPCDNSKTKKEGVSRTYKGCDGYAPIMAYMGREGYLMNCELREGRQHCQKHTPEFIRETIAACRRVTKEPLLFRLDSGNDSSDNISIFLENGCSFITKRNLRRESRESWLLKVKDVCRDIVSPREGKTVYIGSTWRDITYTGSDGGKYPFTVRTVYEITERSIDRNGQYLFPTDVEVNMWDVNVDFSDRDVIALYHAHGESEQFHSEIKTDMNLERFPSGKFSTNELVLELAMPAYNILRMIGDESIGPGHPMRHPVKRRRIGTVIKNLVMMACHVTMHARKSRIGLGGSNVWRRTFQKVSLSFSCL